VALAASVFLLQASISQAAIVYTLNFAPETVGATGTGTGTVTFDDVANTMHIELSFSGLSGVTTVAHIRAATATPFTGTAGIATELATFTGFPSGVSAGTYTRTFDMTQTSSFSPAYIAAKGNTAAGAFASLLSASAEGRAYLNIHTSSVPPGEIRSFLTAVPEPSGLILIGIASLKLAAQRRRRVTA
jgi:hypothetical protein